MLKFRTYLERQQPPMVLELITPACANTGLFVTIPCFDEPDLLESLKSLAACHPPFATVTVIVVVNASEKASPEVQAQNMKSIREVLDWWEHSPRPFFHLRLLHAPALPAKWAGVGWARKIAMDAAIGSIDQSEMEDGILIAFDADSTVTTNYFTAIENGFRENNSFNFVTINFSHEVDDPELTPSLREGIIRYELYLRYLRNAMQWCGYPHAIHTVGSSFAVRASAYVKQGGMNRRQAGEDFHFLHKMVLLGNYGRIGEATVTPSCRISHRVPFGTGAALKRWEAGDQELKTTYALELFRTLKPLLKDPLFFFNNDDQNWPLRLDHFDARLQRCLATTKTTERLKELKKNCGDAKTFVRRFYHEISAFWIIQYLNQCEESKGGKGMLEVEATSLLSEQGVDLPQVLSTRELLNIYRNIDNPKEQK